MKKSTLLVGLFVVVFLAMNTVTFAVESAENTGTATQYGTQEIQSKSEIEAQRAELRAQKAAEFASYQIEREKKMEAQAVMVQEKTQERAQIIENKAISIQERRQERIAVFSENLVEKVLKYYDRLSLLSAKLAAKIIELDQRNLDVSVAEQKLAIADKALEEAYQNAMILVEAIKTTEVESKEGFGQIVSQVSELKNPFREVLSLYKEVVIELKEVTSEENLVTE